MMATEKHVFNPRSVVAAMNCRNFSNYWTATETYEALKIHMDMDFDGLRADIVQMLGGGRVKVNTLMSSVQIGFGLYIGFQVIAQKNDD